MRLHRLVMVVAGLACGSVAQSALPPHPGDAAFETLEGVDVNSNGVRDEVEIALSGLYSDDPQLLAVQFEGARVFDATIILGSKQDEDRAWALRNSTSFDFYAECLNKLEKTSSLQRPEGWSGDRISELRLVSLNTTERADAYSDYHVLSRDFVIRELETFYSGEERVAVDTAGCPTEPYPESGIGDD